MLKLTHVQTFYFDSELKWMLTYENVWQNSIKYAYIINKMSTDISVESYRIRQEFKFPSGKVLILMSRGTDEYS